MLLSLSMRHQRKLQLPSVSGETLRQAGGTSDCGSTQPDPMKFRRSPLSTVPKSRCSGNTVRPSDAANSEFFDCGSFCGYWHPHLERRTCVMLLSHQQKLRLPPISGETLRQAGGTNDFGSTQPDPTKFRRSPLTTVPKSRCSGNTVCPSDAANSEFFDCGSFSAAVGAHLRIATNTANTAIPTGNKSDEQCRRTNFSGGL
ncbi:unnamed protein product [Cuscuta europaea]|uniref:Uncharacterized protein n=1 Tax=Cuscuta europaea TaxID=41803 RepID=A0A9P0Z8C8_CUSEU|nr:unnamed protein product [Cuscuta europaea]